MEHLPEGSPAPDFELATAGGETVKLSEAVERGPVVLAFYKSSCPTSQLTFPYVQTLYAAFEPSRRPIVWGISQDEEGPTREFSAAHGLEFPMLIDEHPYPVSSAYAVRFVPTLYLVDRDGTIRVADFGFSKPALRSVASDLAADLGVPVPAVFAADDTLPERRPG